MGHLKNVAIAVAIGATIVTRAPLDDIAVVADTGIVQVADNLYDTAEHLYDIVHERKELIERDELSHDENIVRVGDHDKELRGDF